MTNNVTITKSGVGTVYIFTQSIEELITKKPRYIRVPRSYQKWDQGPKTMVIDTLVVTHNFVINGEITRAEGDTAQQQRDKLRTIAEQKGGTVTLNYDGTDYEVFIDKCSIKEESHDEDTPDSYSVILNVTEAEQRGGS